MGNPEVKRPGEAYEDWKAPENGREKDGLQPEDRPDIEEAFNANWRKLNQDAEGDKWDDAKLDNIIREFHAAKKRILDGGVISPEDVEYLSAAIGNKRRELIQERQSIPQDDKVAAQKNFDNIARFDRLDQTVIANSELVLPQETNQADANESSRIAPLGDEQPSSAENTPVVEPKTELETIRFGEGILLSDPRITVNHLNQARERILNNRAANQRALDKDKDNSSIQIVMQSFDRDLDTIDQWIKLKEGKA